MKKHALHIILLFPLFLSAQITSPVIRANFGLDADVRSNFFNLLWSPGNDDWFGNGSLGSGIHVIDTTGAAAIVSAYTSNPASKGYAFARGMRYPVLSTISGRILYDASYVRDYRGTDTTSFAGGNKNAQSPQLWSTAISPVLSKNDITEVYLHVRRDGTTPSDSLWFFGAVGILGTNGDRYFDFELYQTDISFNGTTRKFEHYGPDYGHTTWKFDASGNITQLGDIIFTAEYGNSGLNFIEARVWVKKTDITTVSPGAFDWTGTFDGDGTGATHGYAGIIPNNGGTFYQGLQNSVSTWSGPFGNFNTGNAHVSNYDAIQFMEFGVNLSKLGLDPMTFTNGSMCNLAFGKVLVKTRTSTSFTASISDFVSPFSFRSVASVAATADFPAMCPLQFISNLSVRNPLSTSTYYWSTSNGHIVGSSTGTSITVDQPGTYIVTQELLSGCGENGRDTIIITSAGNCSVLASKLHFFKGAERQNIVALNWRISNNNNVNNIIIERSLNGSNFYPIGSLQGKSGAETADYYFSDSLYNIDHETVYYRLHITDKNNGSNYSDIISFKRSFNKTLSVQVNPNPVNNSYMQVFVTAPYNHTATLQLVHSSGAIVQTQKLLLVKGNNHIPVAANTKWQKGLYILRILTDAGPVQQKVLVTE
ncbi:T9SS type A sorting domain-containing protein [Lacibacter luteus]|uniref:T9SS type A sorting domain-containing protein n=1 Tax=Lacibacter luteus TaxID=2508719 RepID=A0A4Q1CM77_9BACT|nr:T9SS type A sorting domain-containing protein [Lacibacter luteus]RXK62148.1 T9SS type A sorting domain-containing protein [Lacibacter luteus]